jgi:formylglycine-generating enzyme required for sulfatase activity
VASAETVVTEKTFAEGLEARQATRKISCELVVRAIARRGKETVRSIPDEAPCIVEGGDYPIGGENRATFVELFLIGRSPVTNRQYAQYLEAIQRSDPRRSDWALSEIFCDLPAVDLSWREARAYCDWFGDAHGVSCGLPTAVEWEAAARGKQGLLFPWGMTFEPGRCLSLDEHSPGPVPVGSFASGASPCGALDMVGLVWQWTETLEASGEAVLKGGSWMDAAWGLRNNRFILSDPDRVAFNTGFRICIRNISEGRNG